MSITSYLHFILTTTTINYLGRYLLVLDLNVSELKLRTGVLFSRHTGVRSL